jgi:hypothetical protein
MTTINLDEALVGAEAMARELAGGREPSATEVRRIRHWISLGHIRTRKIGQLHVTTRQHLMADIEPRSRVEEAAANAP